MEHHDRIDTFILFTYLFLLYLRNNRNIFELSEQSLAVNMSLPRNYQEYAVIKKFPYLWTKI